MTAVAEPAGPRERLLAAAVELLAREGSGGWTLRRLAEALGTSHRMVIYHFGSLDGLLVAVVEEVEARQRARRVALADTHPDPAEAARALWRELSDPAAAPHERLFFELYAAGLQGRGSAASLPRDAVEEWLAPLTALFAEATGDAEHAPVDARLGLAVVRGLLLDLLATGDREALVAAHERYLELYDWVGEGRP
ncbi:TetR/AcrR family transcriptional regulator [Nocardioides ochotonae]|uniref:TetR/AcrR family transcriptional regulator n=1 Tax=Nocardioides ochotonae TaxID=2685869 RepID=UPI00140B2F2C|nr:TetR/AcrR family transcriptional regulator [Nocardioides ochotonae]